MPLIDLVPVAREITLEPLIASPLLITMPAMRTAIWDGEIHVFDYSFENGLNKSVKLNKQVESMYKTLAKLHLQRNKVAKLCI